MLRACEELDYMTHIVMRMFENTQLPLDDPHRFRVEVLFRCGGAGTGQVEGGVEWGGLGGGGPWWQLGGWGRTTQPAVPPPPTTPGSPVFRTPIPSQHPHLCSHTPNSPGAAYDPTQVMPAKKDHVLPVAPRVPLHPEG